MNEALTEFVDSRGTTLKVEADAGIVRGVKVLGLTSANGRTYRESAISKAIGLYEGAKVNIDHPINGADPRRYADRLGQVRNIRQERDGLYGDLHYNPKHPLAEQISWDAVNAPENLGLSHNVMARTSKSGSQIVVEEILKVNSVDLVADPATTRGLFESKERNMEITLEAVKGERAIVEALRAEFIAEQKASGESKAQADKLAALESQLTEAKKTIDDYQIKEKLAARKEQAAKLIAEAKLPAEFVTDVFREQVENAADESAAKLLIEDRAKLVGKASTVTKPQSKSQHVTEGRADLGGVTDLKSAFAALRS